MPGAYWAALRDPPEHAAVLEAAGRVARAAGQARGPVLDVRVQVPLVVPRLREVALALERGRQAEVVLAAAARARPVLVGVEEEQLVVAAGLPDRAANRIAPVALIGHRHGDPIQYVVLGVLVPPRVPLDVVDGPAEPVRAALGHRQDLDAARPPVLGLVGGGQHLHLGDGVQVHGDHLAVVAGVHGRDAVHLDVGVAAAADAADPGRSTRRTARPASAGRGP